MERVPGPGGAVWRSGGPARLRDWHRTRLGTEGPPTDAGPLPREPAPPTGAA